MRSVSIAAPAYNESSAIEAIVSAWASFFAQRSGVEEFEIVICNDGSSDDTGAILEKLAAKHPQLRVITHAKNRGAAAALTTAIRHTTKEWVLLQDTDGQFPIENFFILSGVLKSQPQALAISGARRRKADTLFNRFGSRASAALCNFLHGTHYKDFNCALKLIKGSVVRELNLEAAGMNYSLDLTSKLCEVGIEQTEVEVETVANATPRKRSLRSNWVRARDRFLFVAYLGMRQWLFRLRVLQ